jgi:CRP-like cAMP-binding protein
VAEELSVPLRRLLALRQFAPLSDIDMSELAMVAENLGEVRIRAGTRIAKAGARVPAIYLVIDGKIDAGGDHWGPRQAYGLLEVLARRPAAADAVAEVDTHAYRITAGDAREILEDNFGMLRALLRELAARVLHSCGTRRFGTGTPIAPVADRMTLVERLIALRQHSPLAGARLQALNAIAQLVEQRRWRAGERVLEANAPPDQVIVLLDGTLRASHEVIEPGASIGALEMLAGVHHPLAIDTISPASALCWPATALVDVLEDHADLGLVMISSLAARLLDTVAPN